MKLLFLITLLISHNTTLAAEKPTKLGRASVALLETNIAFDAKLGHGAGQYYPSAATPAEQLVNQGFAMMNVFQYTDAFRSFFSAYKLDPSLKIAVIGVGFAANQLDESNSYYTEYAVSELKASTLDAETQAWAELFSAVAFKKNLSQTDPLSPQYAYFQLTLVDPTNLEVPVFANWFSGTRSVDQFEAVLEKDPDNAGALHFLLHLAEHHHNHDRALGLAEKLITVARGSAHAQHMYGHVLPHFNRWYAADKQFTIAHGLHIAWSQENNVEPGEDWHYMHNLDLWAVTKMVIAPQLVPRILIEIQSIHGPGILDYFDYTAANLYQADEATLTGQLNEQLVSMENSAPNAKQVLMSSRLYFNLVTSPGEASYQAMFDSVDAPLGFKNKRLFAQFRDLVEFNKASNDSAYSEAEETIVDGLASRFKQGGFDGWKNATLEVIKLRRLAEVFDLPQTVTALDTEILNVFMKPVDTPEQ